MRFKYKGTNFNVAKYLDVLLFSFSFTYCRLQENNLNQKVKGQDSLFFNFQNYVCGM